MCSRGPGNCLALGFSQLLLLLPAFILVARAQGSSVPLVTALSGSSVRLHIPGLPTYTSLTWMLTDKQKILDWNDDGVDYYKMRLSDRVKLDNDSSLLISNVQTEDSSTYLMRVIKPDGAEVEKKIQLKVFDPVPKPTVNIESTHVENNNCVLNMSCVVPTPEVNYTWLGDPTIVNTHKMVLEVTLEVNGSGFYTCKVSNSVSSEIATVKHNPPCAPVSSENSSGVTWGATWHAVLWPTLFLVLLA